MTNQIAERNTAVMQAVIDERDAFALGVRALFEANSIEEDRAAREMLRWVLRRVDTREGRAA